MESLISNARYVVGDGDRGERGAIFESTISNARYAVGDGDGGERGATTESLISNARYAIRDGCIFATNNKGIRCSLNNRIAIFTTIVCAITAFNYYSGEGGATFESTISNTRYAVGDSNRGEGGAIIESIISNARHAVGNSDGGEGSAIIESIPFNACYAIGSTVVGNGFGDGGGC